MRIFVAGGTGAIGRVLLPMLRDAGHDLVGLTRSAKHADRLRAMGAAPVVGDVLEAAAVARIVGDARPDVVINELTDLPRAIKPSDIRAAYDRNNRVRQQGTAHLVAAARAAGVRRFLSQSVAFWYAPGGSRLKNEDDPLYVKAPDPVRDGVRALEASERSVLNASDLEGIVLRYGFFYGPGTWIAHDGAMGRLAKEGKYPIVGGGAGVYSFIHVDDAARATAAFVERGRPGVYNVVDDEPAPVSEWLPVFASAVGGPSPRHVPALMAGLVMGRGLVSWMSDIPGVANAKIKQEIEWRPRFASWRRGFAEGLG